ncbi:MAG: hypothetical protein KDA42_02605 [Planctomycetales bacterium]|nr:hypothetical protein [Planctomycetales bacterium]
MSNVTNTAELAALIGRKHDCLVQLRDLGKRQLELVESGDMPQLLKVLAAKGHLIALLQSLERELEPYRTEEPESRRWQSAQLRADTSAKSTACQTLLAEIIAQEKAAEGRMSHRRDEAATRLQGAHVAAAARNAYQSEHSHGRAMLDLSSDA